MADAQTLFIVVQGTLDGIYDFIDAYLAGALTSKINNTCPKPAEHTLPRITSSIYSGLI